METTRRNWTMYPFVPRFSDSKRRNSERARSTALHSQGIQVKSEDGMVMLEGVVGSWAEKESVEKAAWSVPGVTHVENKLLIQERK